MSRPAPIAIAADTIANSFSTHGVNHSPTATGMHDWNTIAPLMFPMASVSLRCRTQITLLNFSGSSVASGATISESTRGARPNVVARPWILSTNSCAPTTIATSATKTCTTMLRVSGAARPCSSRSATASDRRPHFIEWSGPSPSALSPFGSPAVRRTYHTYASTSPRPTATRSGNGFSKSGSPIPIATTYIPRKKRRSRRTMTWLMLRSAERRPRRWKMRTATPVTNIAAVESRNGAPRMAPMPTSSDACVPTKMIAMIGIIVSGIAVPTAASTLPTMPSPRPRRSPSHSTPFVNSSAPARLTRNDTASSARSISSVVSAHLRSAILRPRGVGLRDPQHRPHRSRAERRQRGRHRHGRTPAAAAPAPHRDPGRWRGRDPAADDADGDRDVPPARPGPPAGRRDPSAVDRLQAAQGRGRERRGREGRGQLPRRRHHDPHRGLHHEPRQHPRGRGSRPRQRRAPHRRPRALDGHPHGRRQHRRRAHEPREVADLRRRRRDRVDRGGDGAARLARRSGPAAPGDRPQRAGRPRDGRDHLPRALLPPAAAAAGAGEGRRGLARGLARCGSGASARAAPQQVLDEREQEQSDRDRAEDRRERREAEVVDPDEHPRIAARADERLPQLTLRGVAEHDRDDERREGVLHLAEPVADDPEDEDDEHVLHRVVH